MVNRGWFDFFEALLLLFWLLAVSVLVCAGLVVVPLMAWVAVTELSALAGVFALLLGIAWIPALWGWIVIQGLLFPFKVTVGEGRYRIANGLLRFSLSLRMEEAVVVIYSIYNRGDWGYEAKIKRKKGRRFGLPFIPGPAMSTKHEALQEAQRICQWLQENSAIGEVVLSKWGDTEQIKPGIDYIR
jgi:hypothetical protein